MPDPSTTLVVPCFNEAARLDVQAFTRALNVFPFLRLLFVDDGSRDATRQVLQRLVLGAGTRVDLLALDDNSGKAEAVRRGIVRALGAAPAWVGYWDADLSTPLDALHDFMVVADADPRLEIIMGSRVRILGRDIERRAYRHYIGRLFATAASMVLRVPVYDTQCGAKLFRVTPETATLFQEPFVSRWVFDVELLARYLRLRGPEASGGADGIYEVALKEWHHRPGSKLTVTDPFRAAVDLWRIYRQRVS